MKQRFLGMLLATLPLPFLQAQYYLQDMVQAGKTAANFAAMKNAGVKKMTAAGFDADGSIMQGFLLEQELDVRENTLTTVSQSDFTGKSKVITGFFPDGKPEKSTETSGSFTSISRYSYRTDGKLEQLMITGSDTLQNFSVTEVHRYAYDVNGKVSEMWRLKNGTDSTRVVFITAENGLPGEEQWWKGNRKTETWYYYYNDKGQLTDVARYNPRARRILPDFLFEYNVKGQLIQQTTIPSGSNQYRIWKYQYDSRGLKIRESISNKNKLQEGYITYNYL